MKGTQIGEFEELILLVVGTLYPEAYGSSIRIQIAEQTGRKVALGGIHSALHRLEEKGFLSSALAEETHERGGRRKRLFQVTNTGKQALEHNRDIRNRLWEQIPQPGMEGLKIQRPLPCVGPLGQLIIS